MDNDNFRLDLGFAVLAVEIDKASDYPAAFIGLCDKNGAWVQDLACIRQKMDPITDELLPTFEAIVFGDKNDEDYTDKITCEVHRDYYRAYNEELNQNILVLATSDQRAMELACLYDKETEWQTEYLTDEDFIAGEFEDGLCEYNWTCSFVLQDGIFERIKGVIGLDDLGLINGVAEMR